MRFIVPSKTFAALLGTSLLMALTPSYVSARMVDPSDIRAQIIQDDDQAMGITEACSVFCKAMGLEEQWKLPSCAEYCDEIQENYGYCREVCVEGETYDMEGCETTCECNLCWDEGFGSAGWYSEEEEKHLFSTCAVSRYGYCSNEWEYCHKEPKCESPRVDISGTHQVCSVCECDCWYVTQNYEDHKDEYNLCLDRMCSLFPFDE